MNKLFIYITIILLAAFCPVKAGQPAPAQGRSFFMGFTPWPPDLTPESIDRVYAFIGKHCDIVAHHFDGGIPWQEALEDKPFSSDVENNWKLRTDKTPQGHSVYVAITPLNFNRDTLAPYWGKSDNMPLPSPWNTYPLNHENVKNAFFKYALRVVRYFKPKYLGIGIESNIILTKAPQKWQEYLELNEYVYNGLKLAYPDLVIFSTIQYEHLRGIDDDSKKNAYLQAPGVANLMKHCDITALSTYHYGIYHNRAKDDYFSQALLLGKPVAIAETGAMSRNVKFFGIPIQANEKDQQDFIDFILSQAMRHRFVFVINFVAIDYDKMLDKLPAPIREVSKAWVYTGLEKSNNAAKPALKVWDSYLSLPKQEI